MIQPVYCLKKACTYFYAYSYTVSEAQPGTAREIRGLVILTGFGKTSHNAKNECIKLKSLLQRIEWCLNQSHISIAWVFSSVYIIMQIIILIS